MDTVDAYQAALSTSVAQFRVGYVQIVLGLLFFLLDWTY